jgi:hypothetical protein
MIRANINFPLKAGMPGSGKITLSQSTFYVRDHLLQLTDEENGTGLITTSVNADGCLFAADIAAMPLIQFHGPNSAAKLNQLYFWSGRKNAYCGFDTILHQQPSMAGNPLEIKTQIWAMKESIDETHFLTETFNLQKIGEPQLAEVRPEDALKLVDDLHAQLNTKKLNVPLNFFGANLGQLKQDLHLPVLKSSPAPVTPGGEELNDEPS